MRCMGEWVAVLGVALLLCGPLGCKERASKPTASTGAASKGAASKGAAAERPSSPARAADAPPAAEAAPAREAVADASSPDAAARVGRCVGEPGDKPIMAPCADDCECATGFCYAEAFNGGGFCSMDCNAPSIGDCADLRHPDQPQFQKYGCLQLTALQRRHDLQTTRICVLRCASDAECRRIDPRFDACGNGAGGRLTQWGGYTLAAFNSCVDTSAVDPDAP